MTSRAVLNASLNISAFFSWVAQMPYSQRLVDNKPVGPAVLIYVSLSMYDIIMIKALNNKISSVCWRIDFGQHKRDNCR